jgi:hypothetical protein
MSRSGWFYWSGWFYSITSGLSPTRLGRTDASARGGAGNVHLSALSRVEYELGEFLSFPFVRSQIQSSPNATSSQSLPEPQRVSTV